jgi:ankyrin repeat protein
MIIKAVRWTFIRRYGNVLELLLSQGADVSAKTKQGSTALSLAIKKTTSR